jgi:hypothetical protein
MRRLIKAWWVGTPIPPRKFGESGLIFGLERYKRHWTSKAAHVVAGFWLNYWRWRMGFGLAVIGLWKH